MLFYFAVFIWMYGCESSLLHLALRSGLESKDDKRQYE